MTEWVLLLVLVPAIVVPVVLLFGFAGCDLIFKLKDGATKPTDLVAVALSRTEIKLTWTYTGMNPARFEVKRKRSQDATFEIVSPDDLEDAEFTVTGLEEGTSYDFQVVTVELAEGFRSGPAEITAATLGEVFQTTLPGELDARNRCVVQRIEPSRLAGSGSRVQLTLQNPSGGQLLINRLAISHAAETGDPYDSDGTPTLIVDIAAPLFIPADPTSGTTELATFDFALDQDRPLLVAIDLGALGLMPILAGVNPAEAGAFVSPPNTQEAALADRQTGYTPLANIFLVQRIDAG